MGTCRQTVPVNSNVRATCCSWCCQAHPPTDEGMERQAKICCRCCTAAAAVGVVAPATRKALVNTCPRLYIFRLQIMSAEPGNKCETKSNTGTCTRVSRVKPTQAERTATLTLASCVLLLLLLLLFAAGEAPL